MTVLNVIKSGSGSFKVIIIFWPRVSLSKNLFKNTFHSQNKRNTIRCAPLGKVKVSSRQKDGFQGHWKVLSVSDAVTLDGKVFQTRGAATKNARSPTRRWRDKGRRRRSLTVSFLSPFPPNDVARSPGTAEPYHANIDRRAQRV